MSAVNAGQRVWTLPGMRDLAEADWLRSRWAEDRLRDYFLLHGYRVLAPPVLEYTELFLRKSGGQLASRMYTFTDPGGNLVSLRPEFTSSIMRNLVEGDDWAMPLRLQYCGPVFRYEEEQRGLRQFTQVGAELVGVGGAMADAEGLSLAKGALSALGLADPRLTLGDVSVHRALLEACGLSDRATAFVLGALQDLEHGPDALERAWQQADKVGLLASDDRSGHLPAFIREMDGPDARELLRGLLDLTGADEGSVGQRTSDEVVDRLLRKAQAVDEPAHLKRGMEAATALAGIKGEPTRALSDARMLLGDYAADTSHLDSLARSLELLAYDSGPGEIKLDFGLARELAYYTGIIFEITSGDSGASLGGGGRYDGLARALGLPVELPALGFAYSLEAVLDSMSASAYEAQAPATATGYIWPTGDGAYRHALAVASGLRERGHPVVIEACSRDLEGAVAFARSQGYPSVLAVNADGTTTTHSTS